MRVRVVGAGAVRPWRVATLPAPRARADRLLVWLLPAAVLVAGRLVFTWLAAPAHLLVTLGGWVLFAMVAVYLGIPADLPAYAAVAGAALTAVGPLASIGHRRRTAGPPPVEGPGGPPLPWSSSEAPGVVS